MQHLKITEQENDPQIKEGYIQLIPLTPETSFRMTSGGGSVQERALMYAILRRMPDFKGHAASLEKFMILDAVKAWTCYLIIYMKEDIINSLHIPIIM